jgi:NADH-quinone oxidoreductase subunit D
MAEIRNYTMNFGPQHPAARGAAARARFDGEVMSARTASGCCTATEKLAETRTYIQSLPYMDRLDYVHDVQQHGICIRSRSSSAFACPRSTSA